LHLYSSPGEMKRRGGRKKSPLAGFGVWARVGLGLVVEKLLAGF